VYDELHSLTLAVHFQDWFYVCPAHLKDTGFCTPKIDQAAIEARKKRELEEEIERVKKEYEEKQKRKKEKEAKGDKKDEAGDKEGKDKKPDEDTEDTKNAQGKTEPVSTTEALLLAAASD
jgi:chromatin remodeling complex protein RSC6